MSNITIYRHGVLSVGLFLLLVLAIAVHPAALNAGEVEAQHKQLKSSTRQDEQGNSLSTMDWLKLYKKNGWERSKYANYQSASFKKNSFLQMKPDFSKLHEKAKDHAKFSLDERPGVKLLRSFGAVKSVTAEKTGMHSGIEAITDLLLNGENPDTLTAGDSLVITFDFTGPGDTAWIALYWDANGNQEIDSGDMEFESPGEGYVIDNDELDEDLTIGSYQMTLNPMDGEELFWLLVSDSDFLFKVTDFVGADTAALHIEPIVSAYGISGTITPDTAGILVVALACEDPSCMNITGENVSLTITDDFGDYTVYVPDGAAGFYLVLPFDIFNLYGGLFPMPPLYVVFVNGMETGFDFDFQPGDATVNVLLEDDSAVSIEGIPIYLLSEGFGGIRVDTTDASGMASFSVVEDDYIVFVEPEYLQPAYLIPFHENIYVSGGSVIWVNFTAYINDDEITGVTYFENVPTGGYRIDAFSDIGWAYTDSEMGASSAEGDYVLPVSSAANSAGSDGYCVSACHLKENEFVEEEYNNVHSGSTGIDFHIYEVDGMIEGIVFDDSSILPIEFAWVCAVDIDDTSLVSCVGTDSSGYYSMPIENGTYILFADAEGYYFDWEDSVVVADDTLWIDFYLSPFEPGQPGAIEGMVLDNETGQPVGGAFVQAWGSFSGYGEAFTDDSGYYFIDVPSDMYFMMATAPGYEPDWEDEINVDGDTVGVDFHLDSTSIEFPHVIEVADIPNDQGRQVRVIWLPAWISWAGIDHYSIWRLVNDDQKRPDSPDYLTMNDELWDYIGEVEDVGLDLYSYVAPTLGDSTDEGIWWSTFLIIAHTDIPHIFFPGMPGEGYSIDNLAPSAPVVSGSAVPSGIELSWEQIVDEDFDYYTVYRSLNQGGPFSFLGYTVETVFLDDDVNSGVMYSYVVTATDFAGNEGDFSAEVSVTLTGVDPDGLEIPETFDIAQNFPNPFNPTTSIRFQLPVAERVHLRIFNMKGELVSTIIDENLPAGRYAVDWNGLNSNGRQVASGVYLYQFTAGEYVSVKKMILMR